MGQKSFFTLFDKELAAFAGSLLIFLLEKDRSEKNMLPSEVLSETVHYLKECGDFLGKTEQQALIYPSLLSWGEEKPFAAKRILFVGLDTASKKEEALSELLRVSGGQLAQQVTRLRTEEVLIVLPQNLQLPPQDVAKHLAEGLILGGYSFKAYKNEQGDEVQPRFAFASLDLPAKEVQQGMKNGEKLAGAVCVARDMGNQPGNKWTPAEFAQFALDLRKHKKIKSTVLGKREMEDLKMGAILAVNKGSAVPPTLSVIEFMPAKKKPIVLLVGKGLTFDSGGISAKPPAGMEDMKFDMCGGAAVMATMQAIAEIGLTGLNVVGLVPATENLAGAAALKPGDVVRHYGGITSEVVNTDAEGRLILGDAIAYGIDKYKPDAVIDIATLTGAAVIGLGHHYSGLLSNNEHLAEMLIQAGKKASEPLWRLPLGPEYRKQLDSSMADMKNAADRSGGTITAACYLQEFVGETPWAHLDIAGTAWNFTEKSYVPKGASGVGVRTLVDLLQNWK